MTEEATLAPFYTHPIGNIYSFYLLGRVESPHHYVNWFETIRYATESDMIKIHINSYGGDVSTAVQMMRVLGDTEATVLISVEGYCISAASMIFMCGDVYEVSPNSSFMFHTYSGGTMGKGHEMLDQLVHESEWSKSLLRQVYQDFLTETEIERIVDGKDLWMSSDEVVERLLEKSKKVQGNEEEPEPIEEEVKPVKKSTRGRPKKTS